MRRPLASRAERRNAWRKYYRKTGVLWPDFMLMLVEFEKKRQAELRKQEEIEKQRLMDAAVGFVRRYQFV